MKRFSSLPLALLLAAVSAPAAASQFDWCSCIPALVCEAGDSQCLDYRSQAESMLREVVPDCRADPECSRMLDDTCAQICQAIQANDFSLPPDRGPAVDEEDSRPRRTFEDETQVKEKKEKKEQEKEKEDPECKELIRYRDGQLLRDWEKQKVKHDLAREALKDVKNLRDDINKDNWWTLSAIPEIALAVKTTCNVVSNAVKAVSPHGDLIELGKQMGSLPKDKRVLMIWKALEAGESIGDLATSTIDEILLGFVLEHTGPVGRAVDLLDSTVDAAREVKETLEAKESYRRTLREQTENLESSMKRYEASMKIAVRNMDAVNAVREAIDRYCSKRKPPPVTISPPR